MKLSIPFVVLALLACLAVGACGESKQDKAKSTVCDARADISKQVDQLKGLTVSTVTIDGVQSSLKAISSDLSKIKDAQGDLSGDRRQQVQDATKTFTSQVQSIAGSVGQEHVAQRGQDPADQRAATARHRLQAELRGVDCS